LFLSVIEGCLLSGNADWDSRAWTLGPSLSLPVFTGGRNQAGLQRAQAAHEEAVARYRQQILIAFGEVENHLAAIGYLAQQATAQSRAVDHARRVAEIATQRHRIGIVSYLEVVDTNRARLRTERIQAQLLAQRLQATVRLIKALGGGWHPGTCAGRVR
jgi:multidrug efflux system outer membrane protein